MRERERQGERREKRVRLERHSRESENRDRRQGERKEVETYSERRLRVGGEGEKRGRQ